MTCPSFRPESKINFVSIFENIRKKWKQKLQISFLDKKKNELFCCKSFRAINEIMGKYREF